VRILRQLSRAKIPLLDDSRPLVRVSSRIALALASPVVGLMTTVALSPALGHPYFFPGVVATLIPAILVGARYGVLSATVCSGAFAYLYIEPIGSWAVADAEIRWAMVASTVTNWIVAAICGSARGAHLELRTEHQESNEIHSQREDLLRALAHDVRTPLNVIGMSASMLAKSSDQAVLRRAETIRSAVATIDSMMRDLVEVAKLESGAVRLEREPLDLRAMLTQLTDGLAGSLPVERISVAILNDVPSLDADPQRFSRVLVNLMSNALKYSPGAVTVGAVPQDGRVVVSVHDEGAGIPADELPHVFEKFFRAKAAQTQQGLGLGLYITRILVEAHGGRIWAESALGKGTTFNVAIPSATAPVELGSPLIPPPAGKHTRA
jgi:signal transduction histidine kinase